MKNPIIVDHPLIQHKVSMMRDRSTSYREFRNLVSEISMLMCYEVTRDLPLTAQELETPLSIIKTKVIAGKKLAFVPVTSAGQGMLDGVIELIPAAKIGHIGNYMDPETHQPVQYYCKLPVDVAQREVIRLDPRLPDGITAVSALDALKEAGVKNIKFMTIIAAPEGVKRVQEAYPDVQIYCAALDERCDENGFIVPGLGDVGDRMFGTK